MPLARRVAATAAASMASSKSIVPMTSERCVRVGDVRRGVRRLLGPAVERVGRRGRPLDHAVEAALGVHPVELLGHQEERGDRRGCCRSGSSRELSIAVGRSKNAGMCRSPTRRSRRRGRARPGTSARSRGRRRRRSTSAARSSRRRPRSRSTGRPPAPEVASTSTSAPSVPAGRGDRRHHAGRGLVVRPGVDVDAGLGQRRRDASRALL